MKAIIFLKNSVNNLSLTNTKVLIQVLILRILLYLTPTDISQQLSDWVLAIVEFFSLVIAFSIVYKIRRFKLNPLLLALIVTGFFLFAIPAQESASLLDWLTFTAKLIAYIIGVVLIYRRILIGHLIIMYIAYANLSFIYLVLNQIISWNLFLIGPRAIMYNLIDIAIIILTAFDLVMIITKYFQPPLFQQSSNNTKSTNTIKCYQLDIILALLILISLAMYWLIWWFVK